MARANETSEGVAAYAIDWRGGRYFARCEGCLMECESYGKTPELALRHALDLAECDTRTREATFEALRGLGGRPKARTRRNA